jgi:serine/threonine protein kinase
MRVPPSRHVACFGPFELDLRAGELHCDGHTIRLQEQPFQVLKLLIEQAGEVVSREEMRRRLWPNDTIVEFDQSINSTIKKLRVALGDAAESPRYIETVARRGYRLIVPVSWPTNGTPTIGQEQDAEECKQQVAEQKAADENLIGKKVSHYRVLQILGGGGMGVVYAAEDLKLGRRVALKFLPAELANDPAAMERFEREARAASALNHPNICTIHGVEEHAGRPFLVMELLEGQTVRELVSSAAFRSANSAEGRALRLEKIIDIAVQVTEGLVAAHRKGIIHRDIKPANILVSSNGQAKVLDFGLAKLLHLELQDIKSSTELEPQCGKVADLNLTRTGVAMGTAGYMSPEQVRGEKVDARTDLFSFGLVLYEMATGQQAFNGETAAIVHAAILNQDPIAVRKLNPQTPAKLQEIINRALEKDRDRRYPSATELCADLKSLKTQLEPTKFVRLWMIGAAAVLLMGMFVIFLIDRHGSVRFGLPQVKQRPLTTNSPENAVGSGAISPDGKKLVYSDGKGLHVRLMHNSETRSVPLPDTLNGQDVQWGEAISWFPDSSRFLVNAQQRASATNMFGSQGSSVWSFSIHGEAPQKLRDNAYACAPSPDGSLIPFDTNKGRRGDREIWLMSPDGENARKLYGADEDGYLNCGVWSPHGKRILYVEADKRGTRFVTRDLNGGAPTVIFESADQIPDVAWLSDGRLIYSVWEPVVIGDGNCNFWEMRLDERTGRPLGKPRQLTSWSGFCMSNSSVTADSKKLAFLKWTNHFTTYMAVLDKGGAHIASLGRFTLSETVDQPVDWTPDGKSVILYSNRAGSTGIYQQALGEDNPRLLVLANIMNEPRVTPDGKWLLYVPARHPAETVGPQDLMRMPLAGGEPRFVSTVRFRARIVCARPPSPLCAVAEPDEDHRQLIITAVDAIKGKGSELVRLALDPNEDRWFVDLAPDGEEIAALKHPGGPIYLLSLRSKLMSEIRVKHWTNLRSVRWAADGKGLFVGAGLGPGTLLYVDLAGNASRLWEHASPLLSIASPDGRHLAIADHTMDRNLWMMEDF